jgi:biopolymer transport protein ExbD
MPIHYRCPGCQHLLSITTRKAGVEVPCPLCGELSVVPDAPAADAPVISSPVEDAESRADKSEPSAEMTAPEPDELGGSDNLVDDDLNEPDVRLKLRPAADRFVHGAQNEIGLASADLDVESATARFTATLSAESESDDADENSGGIQLRRASPNLGDLDLTSMVDVTFLLLIFFMVTASFSLQKTIELPKPNADQKGAAQALTLEDLQANTIFVKVDEANQIFVDDVPAGDTTKLEEVLTQARLTTLRTEVAIDAHPECRHETVVQVIDAATAAGMQKVRIISRPGAGD